MKIDFLNHDVHKEKSQGSAESLRNREILRALCG
jgi:hypothetical protein